MTKFDPTAIETERQEVENPSSNDMIDVLHRVHDVVIDAAENIGDVEAFFMGLALKPGSPLTVDKGSNIFLATFGDREPTEYMLGTLQSEISEFHDSRVPTMPRHIANLVNTLQRKGIKVNVGYVNGKGSIQPVNLDDIRVDAAGSVA